MRQEDPAMLRRKLSRPGLVLAVSLLLFSQPVTAGYTIDDDEYFIENDDDTPARKPRGISDVPKRELDAASTRTIGEYAPGEQDMFDIYGNSVTNDPSFKAEFSPLQYVVLNLEEFDSFGTNRIVANNLGGMSIANPSDPPMIRLNEVCTVIPVGTSTPITVDLRIFNTSEYRVANPNNNGLPTGSRDIFQINLRTLFDERDSSDIADSNLAAAIPSLFADLGATAAQKRYSNNLGLVYVFTDRATSNLVELEEFMVSFLDFDQAWADGQRAYTRESLIVADFTTIMVTNTTSLELSFSHQIFSAPITLNTMVSWNPSNGLVSTGDIGPVQKNVAVLRSTELGVGKANLINQKYEGCLGQCVVNNATCTNDRIRIGMTDPALVGTSYTDAHKLTCDVGQPCGPAGQNAPGGGAQAIGCGFADSSPTDDGLPRDPSDPNGASVARKTDYPDCAAHGCVATGDGPAMRPSGSVWPAGNSIPCMVDCPRTTVKSDDGNPSDPMLLTRQQKDRAVVLLYRHRTNFTVIYRNEIGSLLLSNPNTLVYTKVCEPMADIPYCDVWGPQSVNMFPKFNVDGSNGNNPVVFSHDPAVRNPDLAMIVGWITPDGQQQKPKGRNFMFAGATSVVTRPPPTPPPSPPPPSPSPPPPTVIPLPPSPSPPPPSPPPPSPPPPSPPPPSFPPTTGCPLCYRIKWDNPDGAGYRQDRPIFPIDIIPQSGHPLSTGGVITQPLSSCDDIPGSTVPSAIAGMAQWYWWNFTALSEGVFLDPAHATIIDMPGVNAFYAYSYPYSWSANTGRELSDTVNMFFVYDEADRYFVFYIIDKAWDGSGGHLEMKLSPTTWGVSGGDPQFFDKWNKPSDPASTLPSTPLPNGDTLPIMLRDDPWNAYTFESATGKYAFQWEYLQCCTDGMILGPLPKKDLTGTDTFALTFETDCASMKNLGQGTRISMWNPRGPAYTTSGAECGSTLGVTNANNAAGWIHYDVPMHQTCDWTKGIQISAEPCENHCAGFTNCGECSAQLECGWNAVSGVCMASCSTGASLTDYLDLDGREIDHPGTEGRTCDVCSAISDPFACMCEPGCGWAALDNDSLVHSRLGKCISGTPDYPSDQSVKVVQWETKGCPADCGPGPGGSSQSLPSCCPRDGPRSQCYRAAYNEKKAFAQYQLMDQYPVVPATSYPGDHPKQSVAGGKAHTASQSAHPEGIIKVPPTMLPKYDLWKCDGATTTAGAMTVDSSVAFFAYNYPKRYSSNTNYEASNSMVTFLVQGDDCQSYLLVLVDKPGDESGGFLQVDLTTTGVDAPDPVVFFNDPQGFDAFCGGSIQTDALDKYSYSSIYKNGTAEWVWDGCCNDGMVVGPLPYSKDWSVNMQVITKETRGLDTFKIGTYDAERNDMGFVEASIQKATSKWGGLQYDGLECTSWCQRYTDCSSCFKDEQCQFSAAHGGCVAADAYIYDYGCPRPTAEPDTKVIHRLGEAYERESVLDGCDGAFVMRYGLPAGMAMTCPCGHRYRYVTTVYENSTVTGNLMKPLMTTEAVAPRFDYEFTFVDICPTHGGFTFQQGIDYVFQSYLCVAQGTLGRDDCSPVSITKYTHTLTPPPPSPPPPSTPPVG